MDSTSFLPIDFINRMEQDLGPDFHAFLRSYEQDKISALRLNPLKADENTLAQLGDMLDGQVEWCHTGYYYNEEKRPGLHPFHAAGVFYIQDASAQLPVEMLNPVPGDVVLDLCSAPGGKSTQLAGKLKGEGILVSNEPIKNRAKILSENIERLGVRNALVVSEFPDKLADKFPNYFDKILVDAPCSGEGMFRKNHDAAKEWSLDSVQMCAERQSEILDRAYEMLIPGGRLCYSTCTFSKAEDEECIASFLARHDDMVLIEEKRLWPHEVKGEGHYAALLEKKTDGNDVDYYRQNRALARGQKIQKQLLNDYLTFVKESLVGTWDENLFLNNDQLYLLPDECPDFTGIHVLRAGIHLGTLKKNRFEPAHALALALVDEEIKNRINFTLVDDSIDNYLHGLTIPGNEKNGWTIVQVEGHSLGWGKNVNGTVKNHYPKGLRALG